MILRKFIFLNLIILTTTLLNIHVSHARIVEARTPMVFKTPEKLNAAIQKIQNYLRQFPTIRVGISGAVNNGHQSAGATVVTRLRQLGYAGHIEVVYTSDVKARLEFLIPPFVSSGPGNQNFPDLNLSFVKERDSSEKNELEEIGLGIMGADDYQIKAKDLKVKTLLKLQPFAWKQPSAIMMAEHNHLVLNQLNSLGYVFSLPHPNNSTKFLNDQMSHTWALAHKIPGLQAIFDNLDHLEMAPAYGHYLKYGLQTLAYLEGIHDALQKRPKLFKTGVVVPLISIIQDEKHFQHLLSINDHLKDSVVFIDIDDPTLKMRCEHPEPGKILLVKTGVVSKPVFEYLYERSTIPPVVEGLNSINLMQMLGRPYLPTAGHEPFHFDRTDLVDENARQDGAYILAEEAMNALIFSQFADRDLIPAHFDNPGPSIGDFIVEAKKPRSPLNALFRRFQTPADDLTHDKLFQGLLKTIQWEKIESRFGKPQPAPYKAPEPEKNRAQQSRAQEIQNDCTEGLQDLALQFGDLIKAWVE